MRPPLGCHHAIAIAAAVLLVPACNKASTSSVSPSCTESSTSSSARVLDPATKRDDIRHLLELTQAANLANQVLRPMFDTFRRTMPQVPAEVWDRVESKFDPNEMVELVISVYEEELNHEDIMAMIEFYESPSGRRVTAALPVVTAKAQEVGRVYGQRIAAEVFSELAAEGYSIQP